ncbi:MAG: LOG family protein [Candidatus Margulisiibacteriota bacterium]
MELSKAVNDKIQDLLTELNITETSPIIEDMLTVVAKLATETSDAHDLKIIRSTLKELRYAFKVFAPYRSQRKVCVFGSARTPEDHPDYLLAKAFSERITQDGFMVITGAGGGIMAAGNEGAAQGSSFGVNIRLPFEQDPNPFIAGSKKLVSFKYFFNRKLTFFKESDASVVFPGGFGTHDEAFEALTLLQTGRGRPRPIIFMASPGNPYWEKWDDFIRTELLKNELISPEDTELYTIANSAEEAAEEIRRFYVRFHSIRYFKDTVVIRMEKPLSQESLGYLDSAFRLLTKEGFSQMSADALPEELVADAEDFPDKTRLVFRFHQKSYGHLMALVKLLNQLD